MKQARKEAAQRSRRIIYNNDGDDIAAGGTPEKFLAARFRQLVSTQVDSVFYCTGVTGMFYAHVPQVGEPIGEAIPEDTGGFVGALRDNFRSLTEAGHDPFELVIQFCRENNVELFFSMRMNDVHDSYYPDLLFRWKREHPEYLFGNSEDYSRYDGTNPRAWWSFFNYEIPEVREYIFRILEDVCQRYDIDGLELDWFRHALFFGPTMDLQPVEPKHVAIMNDFMRRVRKMTERVGQQRGRPLPVACHVPNSVERSLALGLDVVTWLRDDLCDILVVGSGYVPMGMAPQIREMTEFAHGYDVPVYANINNSPRFWASSLEHWRGAAMNIWHAGADGIQIFNLYPAQPDERLSQMGSPETLKGLDKIYGLDYMVEEKLLGCIRTGMVTPDRLPIPLVAGGTVTAKFPVGEDIVANAPEGKTTHTRLRLRVSSLAEGDEVTVKLNGKALETPAPTEPLTAEPAAAWLELDADPHLVQAGENLVEVELSTPRASGEPVVLDRLELVVRYQ